MKRGNSTVEGVAQNIEACATDVLREHKFGWGHAKVLSDEGNHLAFILNTTRESCNREREILE